MATKQRDEQDAATPEAVLTYHCPAHAQFFPDEDAFRPYTEFRVDPVNLERVHDRACLNLHFNQHQRASGGGPLAEVGHERRCQQIRG
jgi:hypothetical protein